MTTILIKKKDTAGAPAAGDLTNAAGGTEIAVNTATKRIYTKDAGGNVVELGTNASASTVADLTVTTSTTLSYGTANQVQYLNASKLLVGSANFTWDGTTLSAVGRLYNGSASTFGASTWGMSLGNGGVSANYFKASTTYWQDDTGSQIMQLSSAALAVTGTGIGGANDGLFTVTNTAANSYGAMSLIGNSRGGYINFYNGATAQASILGQANTLSVYAGSNSSGTAIANFTATGLGISTTPSAPLQVAGNALVGVTTSGGMGAQSGLTVVGGSNVSDNAAGAVTIGSHYNSRTTGDNIGRLDFYSNDASGGASGIQASVRAVTASAIGDSAYLGFYTGTSSSMPLRAVISETGNFYLNNTNPSSGGATFAMNTASPTEYFDVNTNDDYGQFTAALGGSPYLGLRFARGNLSAKTTLVSGDQQNIVFQGYDGASFINMARITVVAASTVSSGTVPGRIAFETAAAGSVVPAFHINQNQYCTIGPAATNGVPLYISQTAQSSFEAAIYVYPTATPTHSSHILFNSSGAGAAIFGRSNSAGVIQGFTSGTNYSTVLGNTSTLPLYFITNSAHAMNIGSGQFVTVSNTGSTGNAPLSVVTPTASAAGYMFEVNPTTSSNASVLYINNAGAGSLYLGRASSAGTGAPVAMNAAESFMIHSGNQRLVLGSNSLRALIIDANGYVTTPYQVSFNAYASASLSGAQAPVVFNSTRHNKGSGYSTSTGRFTAPVDGTYFFSVTNNLQNAAGADGLIRKNGSNIIGVEFDYATSSNWLGLTATTILELVAGDYVDYTIGAGSATTVEGTPWNTFVGYLLG